ncbi:GAF and ANTAR domain-containing protein [Actinoplanes sp. NPDC023714]|uniref:GAF and ANTAR domain-containing protein n=1 Tax=Actinoplanes sp. NPDC023714 TaxID=3154322 RepID=UPI0033EA0151
MSTLDPAVLAASLRRLGDLEEHDIATAVGEVIHAAVDLFQVDGSGLMIVDAQHDLRYVASSNRQSEVMERVQSTAGEGPCVAAFVTDGVVHTDDLNTDERWPLIREPFLRNGVVSVLGAPVRLGGAPVGTLDVFRNRPYAWSEAEAAALERYTDILESMLATALAAHQAGELAGQLQYALDYRVVIERAVGYLMAQRSTGPDEAFSLLRSTARNQRRKVADVAAHLLEHGTLPKPPA